jgi:MarR family transcriptional regulator, organic hydroperoxide resistance regulator
MRRPAGAVKVAGPKRSSPSAKRRPAKTAGTAGVAGAKETGSPATKGPAKRASSKGSSPVAAETEWTPELDELGKAFRGVFRSLNRLRGRDTHLGGAELSHAQFELLIELYERGELPAGELAAAARLTPATVTQMLEHLAACGHVERARSDTDRRVVVSRLSTQGKRKIEAKRAAWRGRWEQALEGMGSSELSAATRVLERLGTAFEDAPAARGCDAPNQDVNLGPGTPV